jgi:hypothetical protein
MAGKNYERKYIYCIERNTIIIIWSFTFNYNFIDFFTDSMGFAGYVAVCVQLYCRCFPVLHLVVTVLHYMFCTHACLSAQETAKLMKKKRTKTTNGKCAKCNHVQEKAKNQRSRFLQEYESKNILHT